MSNKKDPQTEGMSKGLTQYGDPGFSLFLRKAFIKGAGYTDSALDRPVIGIANTGSAYNPCHGNAPQLIEAIERGVMLAGGLQNWFILKTNLVERWVLIASGVALTYPSTAGDMAGFAGLASVVVVQWLRQSKLKAI